MDLSCLPKDSNITITRAKSSLFFFHFLLLSLLLQKSETPLFTTGNEADKGRSENGEQIVNARQHLKRVSNSYVCNRHGHCLHTQREEKIKSLHSVKLKYAHTPKEPLHTGSVSFFLPLDVRFFSFFMLVFKTLARIKKPLSPYFSF